MRTRILLVLPLVLAAGTPLLLHASSSSTDVGVASEKCVGTYDTYAAGRKVLDGGRYCVPWI